MNNDRKKKIDIIKGRLLAVAREFDSIKGDIEDILDEEETDRNNIPGNMQNSDLYNKADAACDALNSAIDSMDTLISAGPLDLIDDVLGYLENAKE